MRALERAGLASGAVTPDGVIEALESNDYPAVVLQFHPEENVQKLSELCGN